MKLDVMRPQIVVDINPLEARTMAASSSAATACGSAPWCAWRTPPIIRRSKSRYPVIAQSLKLAASQQIRNMASLGGNVLQRTRCTYFRDVSYAACNKRNPGSGCAAIEGFNRMHAVLGTSEQLHRHLPGRFRPGPDRARCRGRNCRRRRRHAPFRSPRCIASPARRPTSETTLRPGELIVSFFVPAAPWTRRSLYLKVRDRAILRIRAGLGRGGARSAKTAWCATPASRSAASRPCRGARTRRKRVLRGKPIDEQTRDGRGRRRIRRRQAATATTISRSHSASAP